MQDCSLLSWHGKWELIVLLTGIKPEGDVGESDRVSLGVVGSDQRLGRAALQHGGQLPRQVVRVLPRSDLHYM